MMRYVVNPSQYNPDGPTVLISVMVIYMASTLITWAKKSKSRVIRTLAILAVIFLIVGTVFGLLRMHRII